MLNVDEVYAFRKINVFIIISFPFNIQHSTFNTKLRANYSETLITLQPGYDFVIFRLYEG